MLNLLKQDAKNLIGWKTRRKLLVFSVDDYGNVRLASKKAREALDKSGMKAVSRFDAFDTLENREDLEMLFEVLGSARDVHGHAAIFTTYALPCNIDFEQMVSVDYKHYEHELLPQTFEKLSQQDSLAYEGAWPMLQEGIKDRLMVPQFHGREHFNVKVFEDLLKEKDQELLTSLKNRSLANLNPSSSQGPGYTSAFGFKDYEENQSFEQIIREGLDAFEQVYGYPAVHFTPPGGGEHSIVHRYAGKYGIKYVDVPMIKKEHQGHGKYKTRVYYTGKRNVAGITYLVRNVVFEPTEHDASEAVNLAIKQIEAAFRWNRPAIISSHRVNFCGHVDPGNRKEGLAALKELLKRITALWPDVEFISADQLGDLIANEES
jgi:hypothetical protein